MLCPSKLFFGTPDPEPPLDEKSLWLGTANIWPDSDADERTDVPEQSLEASWNESEEERRSFVGGRQVGARAEKPLPLITSAGACQSPAAGLPLLRPVADQPPPGLPCLSTDEIRGPALVQPVAQLLVDAGPEQDDSEAEEDADDERSQLEDDDDGQALNESGVIALDGSAPRYSELPSIGSALHFSGNCDRCCFHPKGRCHNGFNCQHCHFDHEKRKRKNKKKNKTKQLQLNCGDTMEMLSMDGSSAPVSPDQPFGPGMLPPADFQVPVAATSQHTTTALGTSPFLPPQLAPQPPYYSSMQVPRPATPSGTADAVDNKWYHHVAPHPPPQTAPPAAPPPAPASGPNATLPGAMLTSTGLPGAPPAGPPPAGPPPQPIDGGAAYANGPPNYEFGGPMAQHDHILATVGSAARADRPDMDHRYASEQEKRDLYIRHLENENRYLRACLIQCLGPNAVLDPPLGAPGSCTLPEVLASGPPTGPPGMSPNMGGLQQDGMGAPMAPYNSAAGIMPSTGVRATMPPGNGMGLSTHGVSLGGMSASAPPFWPVGTQAVGASSAGSHQAVGQGWPAPGQEASNIGNAFAGACNVRLHQDAEGCAVSTSGG